MLINTIEEFASLLYSVQWGSRAVARYAGRCAASGMTIAPGDTIIAYHEGWVSSRFVELVELVEGEDSGALQARLTPFEALDALEALYTYRGSRFVLVARDARACEVVRMVYAYGRDYIACESTGDTWSVDELFAREREFIALARLHDLEDVYERDCYALG